MDVKYGRVSLAKENMHVEFGKIILNVKKYNKCSCLKRIRKIVSTRKITIVKF